MSRTTRSFRRGATLAALTVLWLAAGCYHYRTHAPGKIDASTPRGETVWAIAWGLVQEVPAVQDCHGQGLADVTVHDNFGYTLLTVITLGFVSPKRIEWTCADPTPSDAPFGDPSPDPGAGPDDPGDGAED